MLKAKLKTYISDNELYSSKYQCIINIQVYLLLPLKVNLCTSHIQEHVLLNIAEQSVPAPDRPQYRQLILIAIRV